jgi:hypothetical protein
MPFARENLVMLLVRHSTLTAASLQDKAAIMARTFRMRQWILAGTVVAALALLCQSANAGSRRHTTDPRLDAASFIVGTGSTVGYFALRDWRLNSHGRLHGLTAAGAMTVTTMGCMALSPIVGTVMVRRELTFREAYALTADCVIPFIGGWLVNRAFDAHPEWEPKPVRRRR